MLVGQCHQETLSVRTNTLIEKCATNQDENVLGLVINISDR